VLYIFVIIMYTILEYTIKGESGEAMPKTDPNKFSRKRKKGQLAKEIIQLIIERPDISLNEIAGILECTYENIRYMAMHHRRHEKPVYPVVINLTGGGRQDERYIFECLDLTVVDFSYCLINLEEIAGRELLYRGPVGLLPLVPLMRQDDPPETVLEKCAERIGKEVAADDEKSVLYVALAALSSLRFSKELILRVLGVSRLENLPLFDGIREEWEARGETRGELKGKLEMLLDLVEARFGQVPDELKNRLKALKDHEQIKKAMRKAVSAETIEEYMAKLEH